jgi:hypothetical protein
MFGTNWLRSGVVLSLGLLASGWLAATPAAAQGPKGKGKGKGGDAQIIHELRETRALLRKANHDYKGHRVAAVHQITKAIHLLQHHKGKPKQAATVAQGGAGKNTGTAKRGLGANSNQQREPQEVSDRQLRHALKQLRHVVQQLEHRTGHHHREALHHVKKAIHDLEKALQVA